MCVCTCWMPGCSASAATRPSGNGSRSVPLRLDILPVHERNEAHPEHGALLDAAGRAGVDAQILVPLAHGDHEACADVELVEQRLRHLGRRGGAEDAAE